MQEMGFSPQSKKQNLNFLQDALEHFNIWMHKTLRVWKILKLNQKKTSLCQPASIKLKKSENSQVTSEMDQEDLMKNKT